LNAQMILMVKFTLPEELKGLDYETHNDPSTGTSSCLLIRGIMIG